MPKTPTLRATVDPQDDGRYYHQVVLELVEVEELPPVFAAEDIRLEMSSRFKLEGNELFAAGEYTRSERLDRGYTAQAAVRQFCAKGGGCATIDCRFTLQVLFPDAL